MKYCRENDFKPVGKTTFGQKLPEYIATSGGQVRTDDGRPRVWHGIKLVNGVTSVTGVTGV
ncbi:hypothetical protein AKJ57_01035 [candidate division MSBL1 archaeon SCGC-AAA259A05]|uniref:Uncharacterized protein n=1 Tax=candidate division MSBL1 archaeon SCGC-AAA259A05 TaxID=1698259 RepID=A0A133UBG6_9EURY|nr:hypothetical protein AKJ57_01035 [candidate division MSBL1 archaeon SCGC-AAA259A05]